MNVVLHRNIKNVIIGVSCVPLAGLLTISSAWPAQAETSPGTSPSAAPTALTSFAIDKSPSKVWLQSYPSLLKYASVPVLVPASGSMPSSGPYGVPEHYFASGFPDTVVNVNQDGYQVILAGNSIPPWHSEQPYFLGNRTTFSIVVDGDEVLPVRLSAVSVPR